jgi:hypothetical protein
MMRGKAIQRNTRGNGIPRRNPKICNRTPIKLKKMERTVKKQLDSYKQGHESAGLQLANH